MWSDDETVKLVEIWGDDAIQAQLEGCRRNKSVYERIAKEMTEANYPRSAEQCREKAKKLKTEYRKIKDSHNVTGRGRKNWKFFEAMDEAFGHKHASEPPIVLDTSDEASTHQQPVPLDCEDDDACITGSGNTSAASGSTNTSSVSCSANTSGASGSTNTSILGSANTTAASGSSTKQSEVSPAQA